MSALREERCRPIDGVEERLDETQVQALLSELEGWQADADGLFKEFRFASYASVMLFVNTLAWLAERERHHPELEVAHDRVVVSYRTHAIGGVSRNDFICAAKIDALGTI